MARMFFDEDMVHDTEVREQVGEIDPILQAIEPYDLPLAGGNVTGVAVGVFDVALYLLALQEPVDKKTTELPFLWAEFVQLDLVSVQARPMVDVENVLKGRVLFSRYLREVLQQSRFGDGVGLSQYKIVSVRK